MTVFISGPISGVENNNIEAFRVAYMELIEAGHYPVNPIFIGRKLKETMGREPTWSEYMRESIKALCNCDGIYMLDGWEKSSGARLEEHIAMRLSIKRME